MLSIVSGAVLPIVALGFIKSLVDYIKPSPDNIVIPNVYTNDEYFEDLDELDADAFANADKENAIISDDISVDQEESNDELLEFPSLDAGSSNNTQGDESIFRRRESTFYDSDPTRL
jgi:hypothetical protein